MRGIWKFPLACERETPAMGLISQGCTQRKLTPGRAHRHRNRWKTGLAGDAERMMGRFLRCLIGQRNRHGSGGLGGRTGSG